MYGQIVWIDKRNSQLPNSRTVQLSNVALQLPNGTFQLPNETVHKCTVCNQVYSSFASFDKHKCPLLQNITYKCEKCDYTSIYKASVQRHFKSQHSTKKEKTPEKLRLICAKCNLVYTDFAEHSKTCEKLFGKEEVVENEPKKVDYSVYQCTVCHKRYSTKLTFEAHKCPPTNVLFKCEKCDFTNKCKYRVREHFQINHVPLEKRKIKATCGNCKKGFYTRQGFKNHEEYCIQKSQDTTQYKCEHCGVFLIGKHNLDTHIKRSHTEREKIHTCELCGKSWSRLGDLNQHQKDVHPSKADCQKVKCHCGKCLEKFENSVELNQHLKECLEKFEYLRCGLCDQDTWGNFIALKKHNAEVHQQILYKCDTCEKIFNNVPSLNAHKERHGTQLQCLECYQFFQSKHALDKHLLNIHNDTNVRHYSCEFCDQKFIQKVRYDEHVNMKHTKKQIYKCPQCNFTTLRKDGVKDHIQVVHEKKIVAACPYGCKKEFTKKAWVYQNHLKKCHLKPKSTETEKCEK